MFLPLCFRDLREPVSFESLRAQNEGEALSAGMGSVFSTQNSELNELTRRNAFLKRVMGIFAVSAVVETPGSTGPKAPEPGTVLCPG